LTGFHGTTGPINRFSPVPMTSQITSFYPIAAHLADQPHIQTAPTKAEAAPFNTFYPSCGETGLIPNRNRYTLAAQRDKTLFVGE